MNGSSSQEFQWSRQKSAKTEFKKQRTKSVMLSFQNETELFLETYPNKSKMGKQENERRCYIKTSNPIISYGTKNEEEKKQKSIK